MDICFQGQIFSPWEKHNMLSVLLGCCLYVFLCRTKKSFKWRGAEPCTMMHHGPAVLPPPDSEAG